MCIYFAGGFFNSLFNFCGDNLSVDGLVERKGDIDSGAVILFFLFEFEVLEWEILNVHAISDFCFDLVSVSL